MPGRGGDAPPGRDTRRLFLAVFPPPGVQAAAARACDAMRSGGDGVSWVRRENLHYTLRFLGDLGADGARRAAEAAGEAAADHRAFEAELGGLGCFPNAHRARVLWLGMVEGGEELRALARSLEEALVRRGFGRADKPFAPHLTVARLREPSDWTDRLAAAPVAGARFAVDRVRLVKSTLSPRGSIYEVVSEARLGPAA